ncbi:hypothetical protein BV22DRAFT_1028703 [Leucogyrophana mollusca]|uniref:Uncharacterized protein n=1 Tax=Leucogyrophana mollusca TaxID=85980 RepID=A0ACB8BZQ4_9AGAM|nr:hypothetical protein BV22DRAFT_1028703 [Leucogyrophana mollusca]
MKFTLAAAFVSVVPAVLAQQLTVNTPPNVVECEPTQFTWSGGVGPYYLSLTPGGQSMASPIKQFPTQTGTSYTWLVDLQANTIFNIDLKDSTGATAFSSIVTIEAGSSTSCLNTAVQEGGSSSGSAAPSASGGSAPPASSASAPAASGSSSPTSGGSTGGSSSGSSSPSPSASGKTGGAARLTVSSAFGVAGVMGLVGAALF